MRRIGSLMAVGVLVVGCAAAGQPPAAGGAVTQVATSTASPSSVAATVVIDRFGDFAFRPVDLTQLLAFVPTAAEEGRYSLAARPEVKPANARARQMQSGNHALEYRFPAPSELGEGLILAGVTATSLAAPPSDPAQVEAWLTPLQRAWAADATMMRPYSFQGPRFAPGEGYDPTVVQDVRGVLANAGWPLGYVSRARREALYFYASGLVARVRWQVPDLTADTVPISAAEAIRRYDLAIRDPEARSIEARTGLDFFLGVPYGEAYPPSTWDDWNNFDADVPAYDFPVDTPWDARFDYGFAGKPVWNIGVHTGAGFGGGMVDARTGEVVRFYRVTRRWQLGPLGAPSPFASMPGPMASAPLP